MTAGEAPSTFAKYQERGGVFERFRDLEFFRSFANQQGTWSPDMERRDRHRTGDPVCGGGGDPASSVDESSTEAKE